MNTCTREQKKGIISGQSIQVIGMSKGRTSVRQPAHALDDLQQSEARFRAMFNTAAVGIGIMSLERRIIDANPAMCRMLGMTREEIIGQTPVIVTHPEDYTSSTRSFEDLVAGRQEYYWAERRYVRKNGEIFWAHVTMSIVRSSDGKPLYLVGMVVDIDEQKKAHAQMEESEQRFRAVFENAGIGIALVRPDRTPLAVNDAILRISGYTREEMLNANGFDLGYPEDRAIGTVEFRDLMARKVNSYQVERRYQHKSGRPYWVRQTISGVHDSEDRVQYLVVMVEDIEQEKQAQERLRESESRFRAMLDNTSVGIALTDLDRRILQVNEAAARITGYSLDELLAINPVDLALPEDRYLAQDALVEMISGHRDSMTVERRYVRKNGEIFWGRVTYSLVRDRAGEPQYLIGLIEDINEQKLATEKLAAQEAEYLRTLEQRVEDRTRDLREANLRLAAEIEQRQRAEEALATKAVEDAVLAERTRLARDLHDAVTQTLYSASLISEVLPDLWDVDPEEARKSNEELRQLTRGALAEMRTLLLELRPAALTQARLPDLIKQLSEAVIGRARLPVDLSVEGDYQLPPDVKVGLYRIAQESLNNIVKYARATQIDINIYLACDEARLEIKDNGIGFEPSAVKPTSLGMRIMRERAEAIGACFVMTGSPGHGTTIAVNWNEDNVPTSAITMRGES